MTKQKHFYLVRGLVREAGHWGSFPELLREKYGECQVTTIDIPGSGENLDLPSPLSVSEMVKHMRQKYLLRKAPDEEAIIISISLGGMVATEWMKSYPSDFDRAVLINTSFGKISPIFHRMKPEALAFLMKVPMLKGRSREERILKLVTNHSHIFEATLDEWEKVQLERPVTLKNAIRQLMAAASFSPGTWRPDIPVLLLASTKDRLVNVKCSRAIAKSWELPLIEHPTGGHELSNDDPQWVVDQVEIFLTGLKVHA